MLNFKQITTSHCVVLICMLQTTHMKTLILSILTLSILLSSCGDVKTAEKNNSSSKTESSEFISHRHLHEKKYEGINLNSESEWDSLNNITFQQTLHKTGKLHPDVHSFGWHIYSNGSLWKNYNFSMLWGISYFSYSIDSKTGSYKSIHQWKTTAMIDTAQAHGTKVFLSVSNFGSKNNAIFLENQKAQNTLMDSLIDLLAYRSADGINIDFEGIEKESKTNFTQFIEAISKRLKRENSKYQISLCLYADDWDDIFDITAIDSYVDFYTLMGYDYYGGFSKTTGPVTPFKTSDKFGKGLIASVKAYENKGLQMDKLIVGLPYYGAEWTTKKPQPGSPVVKFNSHPPYKNIRKEYIEKLHIPVQFDSVSESSYLVMKESENSYRQLFFEDTLSLGIKYDWIKRNKIRGVGFWALGYDDGYTELWDLLIEKFSVE